MEIPGSDFFEQYYETVDSLLASSYTSYVCTLYYPPLVTACTNCVYSGKGGTNVYNGTGPKPFTFGVCPVCGGKGKRETQNTEEVRLRIYWDRASWIRGYSKADETMRYPSGSLQILGKLGDSAKILKSNKIVVNSQEERYRRWEYKLDSEIFKHGFGNQYFFAYLTRI